jgi:hypothetical protein
MEDKGQPSLDGISGQTEKESTENNCQSSHRGISGQITLSEIGGISGQTGDDKAQLSVGGIGRQTKQHTEDKAQLSVGGISGQTGEQHTGSAAVNAGGFV